MKTITLLLIILTCNLNLIAIDINNKVSPLVTCTWLEENISNPDLVILHIAAVERDFNNGHIPGARFLWPGSITISSKTESVIPADIKDIIKVIEGMGISNNSHIILCGIYGNLIQVCRVFVTLEHIGLKGRVSILDGGFDEWQRSGHTVSIENTVSKKGKLVSTLQENLVNIDWITMNLKNNSYNIIDARPKPYYEGSMGTPRQGHIPGAKNLPQPDLYDSKTFQFNQTEKLQEQFRKLDIPAGARPVFYCFIGNSACVAYVAATIAGYDPILYDGSMEEWGSRFDLPIEKN